MTDIVLTAIQMNFMAEHASLGLARSWVSLATDDSADFDFYSRVEPVTLAIADEVYQQKGSIIANDLRSSQLYIVRKAYQSLGNCLDADATETLVRGVEQVLRKTIQIPESAEMAFRILMQDMTAGDDLGKRVQQAMDHYVSLGPGRHFKIYRDFHIKGNDVETTKLVLQNIMEHKDDPLQALELRLTFSSDLNNKYFGGSLLGLYEGPHEPALQAAIQNTRFFLWDILSQRGKQAKDPKNYKAYLQLARRVMRIVDFVVKHGGERHVRVEDMDELLAILDTERARLHKKGIV